MSLQREAVDIMNLAYNGLYLPHAYNLTLTSAKQSSGPITCGAGDAGGDSTPDF